MQRLTKINLSELSHYVPSGMHRLNLLLTRGFISSHIALGEPSCCLTQALLVAMFVFFEKILAFIIEMGELASDLDVPIQGCFLVRC